MRALIAIAALLAAGLAQAQNELSFTLDLSTATPELTWSTTPAADTCEASGAWTGEKGPAGSEALPAIASSAFTIVCSWAGDSIATLSWANPTENTDGTPYSDPGQTFIRYAPGQDPRHGLGGVTLAEATADCDQGAIRCVLGLDPTFTMHTITGLAEGEWQFVAHACNAMDLCSQASNVAAKMITGSVTVTDTITIRVPVAPANLAAQ